MKVTSERLDNCQVKVVVELDAAEVEDRLRKATRDLSRQFNVPGYRRGKAPHAAVIRVFGREAVQQHALEDFGNDLYEKAVEQIEYKPYEVGELQGVEWDPFQMTIMVPIQPDVDLGDYRSVRVPHEVEPVTDEAVTESLERMREENAQWLPVERPAELGDQVVLDLVATAGDVTIRQEDNLEITLEAGATQPLPGLHEQVVGASPGESRSFALSLPGDSDELPQEATVRIEVHTVRSRDLPAMDDELAMMVGDYQTLDDLRAAVREQLETQAHQQADAEYLEKVLDAMIEAAPRIEYPPQAVNHEADRSMRRMETNLAGSGLTFDTFLRMIGKTRDAYRQELRPAAEEQLKKRLVLEKVAEREGFEASPEDIDAEIERMSAMMGPQAEEMRAMLDSPEGRASLANDLVVMRAQELVIRIGKGEGPATAEGQAPEPAADDTQATPEAEAQAPVEEAQPAPEVEAAAEDESPAPGEAGTGQEEVAQEPEAGG